MIEWIIAGMNGSITEKVHQFQVKRGGGRRGTIYASRLLQLESFTVETTQELPYKIALTSTRCRAPAPLSAWGYR